MVLLNLFSLCHGKLSLTGSLYNSSHKKPFQNKSKVSKREDPELCETEGHHPHPIVIVGAGAAGLAAAAILIDVGCHVEVLEAQDKIGGRAFSFDTSSNFPGVDGGAHYVLGGKYNSIISSLLNILELPPMVEVGGDEVYFSKRSSLEMWMSTNSRKELLSNNEIDITFDIESMLQETLRVVWSEWSASVGTDISIAHGLKSAFARLPEFSAFTKATIAWHHYLKFNYSLGAEPALLSLRDFMDTNYTSFYKNGVANNAIIRGGMQVIWDALVEKTGMVVQTGFQVVEIREGPHGVIVRGADDSEIEASAVIVTVPLGVLLGNGIIFEPPIENLKFGNMSTLGIAHVATVILKYNDNSFLKDSSYHGMGYISSNEWLYYSNSVKEGYKSPAYETFYLTESAAREIKNVDHTVVSNKFEKILNEIHGTDAFYPADAIYVSDWNTNEFFNGTWSYVPVGANSSARDVYAEPAFEGRVMFAGEATCTTMPGTVHGAIASGFREALRIIKSPSRWHVRYPSMNIPCHHTL